MRKALFIVALVCGVGVWLPDAFGESAQTVLIIISRENGREPELMLTKEVGVMVSMLTEAGFSVKMSSPSKKAIAGTTTTLMPDLLNTDINPDDYVGYMVPCMALPTLAMKVAPELMETIKQIGATKKALAAQMSSIDILKKAGVLEGRKYAVSKHSGVIRDGNIITSMNCPYMAKYENVDDLTEELTRQFIVMLSSYAVEKP